jgi:Trk K+ transport system NAD-binding subunit
VAEMQVIVDMVVLGARVACQTVPAFRVTSSAPLSSSASHDYVRHACTMRTHHLAEIRGMLCYYCRMQVQAYPAQSHDTATWRGHVVLCGLGRIGEAVTEALLRAGTRLVVIDSGPQSPFKTQLERHGVPVIDGDSTQNETLEAAGVRHAKVVIVAISHDMSSLKTALAARDMNISGRVVMRLFNQRMAEHLRNLPAGIEALSLSAIVAPIFALAARNPWLASAFTVSGSTWAIGTVSVPESASPRFSFEQYRCAGFTVLACTNAEGTTWFPAPGRVPAVGAKLLVAARPFRLHALGSHPEWLHSALQAPDPRVWFDNQRLRDESDQPARRDNIFRKSRRLWHHTNQYLHVALMMQFALFLCSVVVFFLYYPLSLANAVYFTAALVTTVGLGDINLLRAAVPLKLYGVFVMLGGTILMAIIYALIAEFVVSQRIEALLGTPADEADDHYVVAGVGTVGFRVIRLLHEAGERIVAIEESEDARFVTQVRAMGIPVVIGDTSFEDTMRRAQIARARAFISSTSNDLVNIEAALNARAINPDIHVVVRVFDHDMALQARRNLKIPAAFSTAAIGAPVFASAAIGHEAPRAVSVPAGYPGNDSLSVLHIYADEELAGRTVGEVAAARGGGAALLHQPDAGIGEPRFAPPADTTIAIGDLVVLIVAGSEPVFPSDN